MKTSKFYKEHDGDLKITRFFPVWEISGKNRKMGIFDFLSVGDRGWPIAPSSSSCFSEHFSYFTLRNRFSQFFAIRVFPRPVRDPKISLLWKTESQGHNEFKFISEFKNYTTPINSMPKNPKIEKSAKSV